MRSAARTGAIALAALLFITTTGGTPPSPADDGIHKIQHVVIIMQENRSFDSYFGTYPGADGIAMRDGVPIACLPDLQRGSCVRPFHDPHDQDMGGPHGAKASDKAVDGGKMDGFIRVMLGAKSTGGCPTDIPTCVVHGHEHRVMAITTGASFPIIR